MNGYEERIEKTRILAGGKPRPKVQSREEMSESMDAWAAATAHLAHG
jgi:hypothetical protein